MTTAAEVLPADTRRNRISPDRIVRIAVAGLAAAIGYPAGLAVFWLIAVRYWYWQGLGLDDEQVTARAAARAAALERKRQQALSPDARESSGRPEQGRP